MCTQTTIVEKDLFIELWQRNRVFFPLRKRHLALCNSKAAGINCNRSCQNLDKYTVSSKSKQIKIATCMLFQKQARGSRQSGLLLIWHQDTRVQRTVWELNEKGKKTASDALTISGTLHNRNLMQNCVKGCHIYHTWKALYT